MVVTNDDYELPLAIDLVGAKEVSAFTGLTIGTIRSYLSRDKFGGKYKVVIMEEESEV